MTPWGYTDHEYCYSCGTHTPTQSGGANAADADPIPDTRKAVSQEHQGTHEAIKARGLTAETCAKFDYRCATHKDQPVQVAVYRDRSGRPVAQKLRTRDKRFQLLGDTKKMTLFGQHCWSKGKILTICEGEIDAMSASQVQGNRWATVSLPNGASSAVRAIKDNLEWVLNFDLIVLMFDNDEHGQKAAEAAAEVLPVGRAAIARLPFKDANEALMASRGDTIIDAIHQAQPYRPDNIVATTDYRSIIGEDDAASATAPFSLLQEITGGLHKATLVTLTAGSGIGKSTMVREMAFHHHMHGHKVGMIMLEESNKKTLQALTGVFMSKNITVDRSEVDEDEIVEAFDMLFGPDMPEMYLYDHFGSSDLDVICSRIEFMCRGLGVEIVYLDHVSILISGQAFGQNERTLIDTAMTRLRTLVQELNITLVICSHLRRPDGNQGHEDGAQVRLGQLRGSHAIAQLSDVCISLSVDPDDPHNNVRHLTVLKNRHSGRTGPAGTLSFNPDTGRLIEDVLAQLTPLDDDEAEGDTIVAE